MNYLFTTFEDYIKGNLSENERVELEQMLKRDKAIKADFELFRFLRTNLSLRFGNPMLKRELKENLSRLGDKYFVDSGTGSGTVHHLNRKSYRPYLMSIAASLLFLMVVGFGLKQYANANYSSQAFASTMEIEIDTDLVRSGDATVVEIPGQADYFAENYVDAIAQLKTVTADQANYDLVQMYIGDAYYQLGQYENAISGFELALESDYHTEAKWNIARAHLELGQIDQARTQLMELKKSSNDITAKRCDEILDGLNGIMGRVAAF